MRILTVSFRFRAMASQVVTTNLEVLHINSYIRGYHAYMGVWRPVLDEMLILKREPTNVPDKSAVAVYKEDVASSGSCTVQLGLKHIQIPEERY